MSDKDFTTQMAAVRAHAIALWDQKQAEEEAVQLELLAAEKKERTAIEAKLAALGKKERLFVGRMKGRGYTTKEALARVDQIQAQRRPRVRKNRGPVSARWLPPRERQRDKTGFILVSQREMDAMLDREGLVLEDPRFTYRVDPALNKPPVDMGKLVRELVGPSPRRTRLTTIVEETGTNGSEERALSEMMSRLNPKDPFLRILAAEKKLAALEKIKKNKKNEKKYKNLKKKLEEEIKVNKKKLKKLTKKKDKKWVDNLFGYATGRLRPRVVTEGALRVAEVAEVSPSVGLLVATPPRANRAPFLLRSPGSRSPMLSPFPLPHPAKPIPIGKPGWEPPDRFYYPVQESIDLDKLRMVVAQEIKALRARVVPTAAELMRDHPGREKDLGKRKKRRRPRLDGISAYTFDAALEDQQSDNFLTRRKKENRRREMARLQDVAKMKAVVGKKPKSTRPTRLYVSPRRVSPVKKRTTPSRKKKSSPRATARTKSRSSPVSPSIRKKLSFESPVSPRALSRPEAPSSAPCGFKVGDKVKKMKGKGKDKVVQITKVKGGKIAGFFVNGGGKVKMQKAENFSK
jgi:hypothetical protein